MAAVKNHYRTGLDLITALLRLSPRTTLVLAGIDSSMAPITARDEI